AHEGAGRGQDRSRPRARAGPRGPSGSLRAARRRERGEPILRPTYNSVTEVVPMFRRKMVGALVLLAVAGVVGAACGGGGRTSAGPAAATFAPARGALDVGGQMVESHAAAPAPAAVGGEIQLTAV